MEAPTRILSLAFQPTSPRACAASTWSPAHHKSQLGVREHLSLLSRGVWVDVHKLPALWGEGSPEARTSQFWSRYLPQPVSDGFWLHLHFPNTQGPLPWIRLLLRPLKYRGRTSRNRKSAISPPALPICAWDTMQGLLFLEVSWLLRPPIRARGPPLPALLCHHPQGRQASLGAGLPLFYFAFSSLKLLSWAFSYTNDTYKKIKDQDTQSEMHGGDKPWSGGVGPGGLCRGPGARGREASHRIPAKDDTWLHPTGRPRAQSDKEHRSRQLEVLAEDVRVQHRQVGHRLGLGRQVGAGSGFCPTASWQRGHRGPEMPSQDRLPPRPLDNHS